GTWAKAACDHKVVAVAAAASAASRNLVRRIVSPCRWSSGLPWRMSFSLCSFVSLSPPTPGSELLRDAAEKSAARPVLRREHADARAVPDLVDLVEHVDDVEPHRGRLHHRARPLELVADAEIELLVERQRVGVGEAAPQPAAEDHVGGEACAFPQI